MKKKKYGMVIDTKTCVGCGACVAACKTENRVPEGLHRVWIVEEVQGKFPTLQMEIRSERCNHCSNSPCVTNCPTGASYVQKGTNIIQVDPEKCTGCKACIAACPYNARFVTPAGYVSKCSFCNHRLEKDLETACASVCPTHSITTGDLTNPLSKAARLLKKRKSKTLIPEAGTKPNIHYLI
ncbi:MAG: 4Fe-4S dicluster domain-containing protein [Candidatus Aminicenantes bacterium]|nr:4Fe-4S dicluster domain-containing protein [Candidatus Aminicenantes bacterium]